MDFFPTFARIVGGKMPNIPGYPRVSNIEMDPHEDLVDGGLFGWVAGPALKAVEEYKATLKNHPNPPAPNITHF